MKKIECSLWKLVEYFAAILFGYIFILVFLLGDRIDYKMKKTFLIPNYITLLLMVIGYVIYLKKKPKVNLYNKDKSGRYLNEIDIDHWVKVLGIVFFFGQIYVFYNIFFETGWDSGSYILPAARQLAGYSETNVLQSVYFSNYPNNLFLINIFAFVLKLNKKIGVFMNENQAMSIVVLNCLICNVTLQLIYRVVKRLSTRKNALIAFMFSCVLLGMSPWNVICYSDQIAILFPILIYYIYLHEEWNEYIRGIGCIFLGYIGYCIKPQAAMILIAIIIYELLHKIVEIDKTQITKTVGVLLVSCILIGATSIGMKQLYKGEGFQLDKNQKIGMTHFLMMGMNAEYQGLYCENDVETSRSARTYQERSKLNINITQERLSEMKFQGLAKLIADKTLITYNDGTFAWSCEGGFYQFLKANKNDSVSGRLKELYYEDGKFYPLFITTMQIMWLICIFFVWIGIGNKLRKGGKSEKSYVVLLMALLGLTIFEMLFEARARYLYANVPLYIVLMFCGNGRKDMMIGKNAGKER